MNQSRQRRAVEFIWLIMFGDVFWNTHTTNVIRISDEELKNADSFTIDTAGCTIPKMDYLDTSIRRFIQYPDDIQSCPDSKPQLLDNNGTHIWILKRNLRFYNITKYKGSFLTFQCCYTHFGKTSFINETEEIYDTSVKDCTFFDNVIEAEHELVRVRCVYKLKVIYERFYAFPLKKNFNTQRYLPFQQDVTQYNVIVTGLSSMSRLNFPRTMPNTYNFLREREVIELKGYSTLATTRLANILPTISGMDLINLKNTCWPSPQAAFDRCHFIWDRFKDVGYYTAFLEDTFSFSIFNVSENEFDASPTDYYITQLVKLAESVDKNSTEGCMGDKYYYQVVLEYLENLTVTLKSDKLFAVFWESTISKNVNYPMVMDHSFEKFLKDLDESGYLNDTIMIFLSDQGISSSDFGKTKQGRLERRLPLLYFLLPPSFREEYNLAYNNLKTNSLRLTTPFDLHETLVDLISLSYLEDDELSLRINAPSPPSKGISLFTPISPNRTCSDANIHSYWCTCVAHRHVFLKSREIEEAGDFLIHHINKFLSDTPQCANLSVSTIISAQELTNCYEEHIVSDWRDYTLVVRAVPGNSLFQGTLRFQDGGWSVAGTVTRVNNSNDTFSHCDIHKNAFALNPFCYCIL